MGIPQISTSCPSTTGRVIDYHTQASSRQPHCIDSHICQFPLGSYNCWLQDVKNLGELFLLIILRGQYKWTRTMIPIFSINASKSGLSSAITLTGFLSSLHLVHILLVHLVSFRKLHPPGHLCCSLKDLPIASIHSHNTLYLFFYLITM